MDDDQNYKEITELLKKYYGPEEEQMEPFGEFWEKLKGRLDQSSTVSYIAKKNKKIEQNYLDRERQLEEILKKKRSSLKFRHKTLALIVILTALGLAAIAGFKYSTKYNLVNFEDDGVNWSKLHLSQAQKDKLSDIDKKWLSFKKDQESFVQERKILLNKELHQDKLNWALVDKYQREILDRELTLKREQANVFLEKRFVLDEEQTLDLLKQIREKGQRS